MKLIVDKQLQLVLEGNDAYEVQFDFGALPAAQVLTNVIPLIASGENAATYFNGETKKIDPQSRDMQSCFFALGDPDETGIHQTKLCTLPEGFYCNEFLALDPFNPQELAEFQATYGRITGARKRKPPFTPIQEKLRPEPDEYLFTSTNAQLYQRQLHGISASQALFDSVPNRDCVPLYILDRLSAVTFEEAIFAVVDAQNTIRALTRVLVKEKGPLNKTELIQAYSAANFIANRISSSVPFLRLTINNTTEPEIYDLIDAVFIQLARGLLNNDAYRICENPECGRMFTPREMNRRLDTKYCCSRCQERAKHLRYINKHQK